MARAVVAAALLVVALGQAGTVWAGPEADGAAAAVDEAGASLVAGQRRDGGFGDRESGADTVASILALAEAAQTSTAWSAKEAGDAVAAARRGGLGPLDVVDDLAEGDLSPRLAALLVTDVVGPLGLDAMAFDPAGDGTPINLVRVLVEARDDDGTLGGGFSDTLVIAPALALTGRPTGASTGAVVRDGLEGADTATTASGIRALVSAGVDPAGPEVTAALVALARSQRPDGLWSGAEGGGEERTTAAALEAIRVAGYDPARSCWRDAVAPDLRTNDYASPIDALVAAAPEDPGATAAVVSGIAGRWVPIRGPAVGCGGDDGLAPPVPAAILVLGGLTAVSVLGSIRIMTRAS